VNCHPAGLVQAFATQCYSHTSPPSSRLWMGREPSVQALAEDRYLLLMEHPWVLLFAACLFRCGKFASRMDPTRMPRCLKQQAAICLSNTKLQLARQFGGLEWICTLELMQEGGGAFHCPRARDMPLQLCSSTLALVQQLLQRQEAILLCWKANPLAT